MGDRTGIASSALLGHTVVSVRVAELQHHPQNRHFFGVTSPEQDTSLREDIERQGLRTPLIVCGKECSSPEGTILGGHRRYDAAVMLRHEEVPAVLLEGLSADEELDVLLGDNLATSRARTLSQLQRYRIEEAQRAILARRAGQRTDLSGGEKGETAAFIAKKTGEPANAVRNRKKVFGSAASPPELKAAVDGGKVSLTAGAKIVRELEGLTRAERMWSDLTTSSTASATKLTKKPSAKKRAAAPKIVMTPKESKSASEPPEPSDVRARIRSAAIDFDILQRRLLGAMEVVLGSFPPIPSTDTGAAARQRIWVEHLQERLMPFIAATRALIEHRPIVNDLIAHAIGVLEVSGVSTPESHGDEPESR